MSEVPSVPQSPSGFPGTARGWVFYDAVCPVCHAVVARLGDAFGRRGFVFVPLQQLWVAPALGLAPSELRREMKLRRGDGRVVAREMVDSCRPTSSAIARKVRGRSASGP